MRSPAVSGTVKLTSGCSCSDPDYSKVFKIDIEAGSYAEDVVDLKEQLEDLGYKVVDKTQKGRIDVYRVDDE